MKRKLADKRKQERGDARLLADLLTLGRERSNLNVCQWCGMPSAKRNGVCAAHADLGGLK